MATTDPMNTNPLQTADVINIEQSPDYPSNVHQEKTTPDSQGLVNQGNDPSQVVSNVAKKLMPGGAAATVTSAGGMQASTYGIQGRAGKPQKNSMAPSTGVENAKDNLAGTSGDKSAVGSLGKRMAESTGNRLAGNHFKVAGAHQMNITGFLAGYLQKTAEDKSWTDILLPGADEMADKLLQLVYPVKAKSEFNKMPATATELRSAAATRQEQIAKKPKVNKPQSGATQVVAEGNPL